MVNTKVIAAIGLAVSLAAGALPLVTAHNQTVNESGTLAVGAATVSANLDIFTGLVGASCDEASPRPDADWIQIDPNPTDGVAVYEQPVDGTHGHFLDVSGTLDADNTYFDVDNGTADTSDDGCSFLGYGGSAGFVGQDEIGLVPAGADYVNVHAWFGAGTYTYTQTGHTQVTCANPGQNC